MAMAVPGLSALCKLQAGAIMCRIQNCQSPRRLLPSRRTFYTTPTNMPSGSCCKAAQGQRQRQGQGQGRSFELDLRDYGRTLIETVNVELEKLIPLTLSPPTGDVEKIEEAMRYSLLGGGKKSCPVMCIAACEVVGGCRERALPVACALEMIHTASLIVDDLPCMDDDALRRGRPSTHVVFGERVAIQASDALFGLAFRHIAEAYTALHADTVLQVVYEFAKAVGSTGMVGGQYMDLVSAGNPSVDPSLLEYIHSHKSALMAEISMVGGGIIGGGSDEEVERLRGYGRALGLAYQIVDDMLDESSTTEELGKTAGKDKKADKATYPKVYGIEKCKEIVVELTWKAQGFLSNFDHTKAAPLLNFAQHVIARKF